MVVDYYGGSDREIYCTAVVSRVGSPQEELRFSASRRNCEAIRNLESDAELAFEVAQDHLCQVSVDSR